jgi:choline dehydrogenase-like flavoprotein
MDQRMNYDAIIVGSGAGGSAAAYQLTQTGQSVLLVEKGLALPRDGSTLDTEKVMRQGLFMSDEAWLDRHDQIVVPDRLLRALSRQLLGVGYLPLVKAIPLFGTAHACGTLVAGNDPATSVVDGDGKVHGLVNVYVVDSSILPRSSRVNPALTIYAWGLRVASRLQFDGNRQDRRATHLHAQA